MAEATQGKLLDAVALECSQQDKTMLAGTLTRPSLRFIAFSVRRRRDMLCWKCQTLAARAGISVSTLERIERAEPVQNSSLEKVAEALGFFADHYIKETPYKPFDQIADDDLEGMQLDGWPHCDGWVAIDVEPLRSRGQVAAIARCFMHFVTKDSIDDVDNGKSVDPKGLRDLRDLLDILAAENLRNPFSKDFRSSPRSRRRELHKSVLDCVQNIERAMRGVALVGYHQVEDRRCPVPLNVAIVRFQARAVNPAAQKQKFIYFPAHCYLPEPDGDSPGGLVLNPQARNGLVDSAFPDGEA